MLYYYILYWIRKWLGSMFITGLLVDLHSLKDEFIHLTCYVLNPNILYKVKNKIILLLTLKQYGYAHMTKRRMTTWTCWGLLGFFNTNTWRQSKQLFYFNILYFSKKRLSLCLSSLTSNNNCIYKINRGYSMLFCWISVKMSQNSALLVK